VLDIALGSFSLECNSGQAQERGYREGNATNSQSVNSARTAASQDFKPSDENEDCQIHPEKSEPNGDPPTKPQDHDYWNDRPICQWLAD